MCCGVYSLYINKIYDRSRGEEMEAYNLRFIFINWYNITESILGLKMYAINPKANTKIVKQEL